MSGEVRTNVKDGLPVYEVEVDFKYILPSGKEEIFEGGHAYFERRTCIMAGIAGGYGYFGEGFGTYGDGVDQGLIVDEPNQWRYYDKTK